MTPRKNGIAHDRWLGWEVEPFYAVTGHPPLGWKGKVIGYCDAPQVLIETSDGQKHWWRADLTRRIEPMWIPSPRCEFPGAPCRPGMGDLCKFCRLKWLGEKP